MAESTPPVNIRLSISRHNPDTGSLEESSYDVPSNGYISVLGALLYIQETVDSSLAFEFGCRYGICCWCLVKVDGAPKLSCRTEAKSGQVIAPIDRHPPLKDLVVDRTTILKKASTNE